MTLNEPLTASTAGVDDTMVTKAKRKPGRKSIKTDFIRAQPVDMTATDLVKAAARKGINLSAKLVYNVRASDRRAREAAVKIDVPRPRKPGRAQRSFDLWEQAQRAAREKRDAAARNAAQLAALDDSVVIDAPAAPAPRKPPSQHELDFRALVMRLGTERARRMLDTFEYELAAVELGESEG